MVKIIGHRGAAGLELENTLASFEMVKHLGVDAVEFDIQITKDGHFVVLHDATLRRVSNSKSRVSDLTYAQLSEIPLHNGGEVPLLRDVLASLRDVTVIVDVKIRSHLEQLCELLDEFPDLDIRLASKWQANIPEFKRLRPTLPAYAGQRFYMPVGPLRRIRRMKADGIMLYYLWMNPFTYRTAQKYGLEIGIYTLNSAFMAKLFNWLYPNIWICTNRPDVFIKTLRKRI